MQKIAPYRPQDVACAKEACAAFLAVNRPPLPDVHPTCQISLIVPIYNESLIRVQKQIDAFAQQRISKETFELVYIVNNSRHSRTSAQKKAYQQNQKVLRFLKKAQPITVHVVDRSSPELAAEDNSVGLARNTGLHLVAARYLAQERDGILIHTDADTLPTKTTYLREVLRELANPRHIGAAGGVRYVLDVDSQKKADRAHAVRHLSTIRDYFLWNVCVESLHTNDFTIQKYPLRFSGAHMIGKAIASVCVGGFASQQMAEDTSFGEALVRFAKQRRCTILPRREKWILTTAFRESDRTDVSFWRIFALIKKYHDHPPVRSVFAPIYRKYVNDFLIHLEYCRGEMSAVRTFMRQWNVPFRPKKCASLQELSRSLAGTQTYDERIAPLRTWKKRPGHEAYKDVVLESYQASYPSSPLSKVRLSSLKRLVFQNPKRKALVLFKQKEFFDVRLR